MLAVGVFAIWRGREPILRVLGAFVLVTAVAYVFTPLTAAGEQGSRSRSSGTSATWRRRSRWAWPSCPACPRCGRRPRRRAAVLAGADGGARVHGRLARPVEAGPRRRAPSRPAIAGGRRSPPWSRSCARGAAWARRPARACAWRCAAVALGVAVAAGYGEQGHYLTHRYEDTGQVQDLATALRWSRDVRDARIAVAGIRGVFTQYPFYGTDLSNRVQWLGVRGPARLLQPDPELPRSGGGRSMPAATRTWSRPSTPICRAPCATRPRVAGRSRTRMPTSCCARPGEGVRAPRAARSRRAAPARGR